MSKRFVGQAWRVAPWIVVLLCRSAEARAQAPEPPPPPVVAPPAAAPLEPLPAPPVSAPAPPPVTPAAPTPEPVIVPPAVTSEAPPSPALAAPMVVQPRLSWGGTTFDWGTQLSTKILGIGSNYVGTEDEQVVMTWSLTPSYFVFWRPDHQLSVSARLTVYEELTNSNTTAQKRSPQLADIPLGLDYAATLFTRGHGPTLGGVQTMRDPTLLGEGSFRTWGLVWSHLVFPTSPDSRASGVDLGTSLGAGIRQQIPLLGGDSRWLRYLLVTATERWSHAFLGASTSTGFPGRPVTSSIHDPVVPNTLSHTLGLTLSIHRDLQLDSTLQLRNGFPASVGSGGPTCVQIATGCVSPAPIAGGGSAVRSSTRFSLGVSYEIIPELGVALGYLNDASRPAEEGAVGGFFYSIDAKFYTNVTFSFDALYRRIFTTPSAGPAI